MRKAQALSIALFSVSLCALAGAGGGMASAHAMEPSISCTDIKGCSGDGKCNNGVVSHDGCKLTCKDQDPVTCGSGGEEAN